MIENYWQETYIILHTRNVLMELLLNFCFFVHKYKFPCLCIILYLSSNCMNLYLRNKKNNYKNTYEKKDF